MKIKALRAWYARPELAPRIAAPPYDVVDTAEARQLAADNPYSFLHVSRPEIDLAPDTDPYSAPVYEQGRKALQHFQAKGWLLRETEPRLYLYRQMREAHVQHGVVACCATADYEAGVIKTHERTRPDKEADRARHIRTLRAHTGPVFLIYRDHAELRRLAAAAAEGLPMFDFVAPDGVRHTGWRFLDPDRVAGAFAEVPAGYIADGHHRAAAAVRVAHELRTAGANAGAAAEPDWFLATLFPASEVCILPYNRCVRDLNGLPLDKFLQAVAARFAMFPCREPGPLATGTIGMYSAAGWHRLAWTPNPSAPPTERLDVAVLQQRLLDPVLGIRDPRTSTRIEFVGGVLGTAELERRVNTGRAAVAFALPPVTVEQLMAIADAGEILSPKSTWFEPKLRSGLFVHTFD